LQKYEEAEKLAPSPALLYNEGRALQALNRHPAALAKLLAFKAAAPDELLRKVPDLDKLIADLRARVGTLAVTCNVAGARVLVDRTVVGVTPLAEPLKLNAGRIAVDVEAEGYFPSHQTIELKGGELFAFQTTLSTKSTNAILVVNGSSPGADVLIDSEKAGAAPVEKIVPAGTHKLLLRHKSFADTETSVVVEAGQRKEVVVPLRPPGVATKWWFWTSLAAAAATVAAATAIGLSTRSPDTGTIAPGRLMPLARFHASVGFHF
jgi:hypothetical protein